ncbi:MAG: hypothetical protein EOO94_02690, partial [Pedobacter sp.]
MKLFNFRNTFLALSALTVFAVSCKKVEELNEVDEQGVTFVKLLNGGDEPGYYGHSLLGIDFVARAQTITVADIRREAASTEDLSKPFTVVVKDDTAALRIYNDSNGTSITPMPRAWYTPNIAPSSVGGTYTVSFAAGQHAAPI